jgi:hypothetical protein
MICVCGKRLVLLFLSSLLYCLPGSLSRAGETRVVLVGVVPYAMCGLDVNESGRLDFVVGGLDQDAICAVTASGKPLWRRPTEGMPLAIRAADIDGDRDSEIVAIIGTSASKVIILDRAGKLMREINPGVVVYLLRLADVDGDGRKDIIVAGYSGRILVYNYRGQAILNKTVVTRNFLRQMAGLGAGDFDGDGQTEIAYHGSLQLPGIIDSRGEPVRRWMLPSLKGGLIDCVDVDEDGRTELLFACLSQIRVESLSKKLWSLNVGEKPGELAAQSNGVLKHPWEYGGTRSLVAGNFTADKGLEIASFASDGKFDLVSAAGKRLLQTKTRHPMLSIAAADVDGDGFDEVLSSRLHYKNVYVLNFKKGAQSAERVLLRTMATDHVTDGLDRILTQIDAIRRPRTRVRPRTEKLHVLWGMEGTIAPKLMADTIRAIDKKMREMRCENVEYAFMFTLKERGVRKFKRDGICAVGPLASSGASLLDQCREWERMGVRFYPVVSHMGVPTVMPETAKKIMDVAPHACQGYLIWETMVNYPSDIWYDFLHRMDELAKICVQKDKKILFAEEAPFWTALISDPKARAILLKPEYRSVLVPVLKTLRPQGDETDVGAYLGSMLAGEIEAWGVTSEEDFWPMELGYYRGCPDDVVMRQDIMAVALGARYIMVESGHLYFEPLDAKGRYSALFPVAARISREARREHLAIELFRKGLLGPVSADDLLSISPAGFALSKSPKVDRAPMTWEAYGTRMYAGAGLLNTDMTRPLMNAGVNSIARNLYGSKKLMNGVFPSTPWGVVPIFGPDGAGGVGRITKTIRTDGELIITSQKKISAKDAMPDVVRAVQAAATELPFRAEQGVFISARRDGEGGYQVILMDTEMFAPVDIETTVETMIPNLVCYDEITDRRLEMQDRRVTLTVPAGAFRLLRFVPEQEN